MPFELGPTAEVSKTTGNPLSPNTIKVYKANLNKLAKKGFDTPTKIIEDPNGTVVAVNDILVDNESPKYRIMYSAIFWALSGTDYCSKKNPIYDAFVKHKHVPGEP